MEIFRIIAANDHGESVFEAERLGDFKMEAIGVELLDAVIDGVRVIVMCDTLAVRIWGFIQDGSEGGARVFDVEIELAGEQSFVAGNGPPGLVLRKKGVSVLASMW